MVACLTFLRMTAMHSTMAAPELSMQFSIVCKPSSAPSIVLRARVSVPLIESSRQHHVLCKLMTAAIRVRLSYQVMLSTTGAEVEFFGGGSRRCPSDWTRRDRARRGQWCASAGWSRGREGQQCAGERRREGRERELDHLALPDLICQNALVFAAWLGLHPSPSHSHSHPHPLPHCTCTCTPIEGAAVSSARILCLPSFLRPRTLAADVFLTIASSPCVPFARRCLDSW